MISITHNVKDGIRLLDAVQSGFPLALAKALTFTAEAVHKAEGAELRRVIDRPTPYTQRSLFKTSATPARLEARVYFKDSSAVGTGTPATEYLLPQVTGGGRNVKRFEFALQAAGHMPRGWHAVPAQGARLDAYGNVSRGQIIQVLSQLRITLLAGSTRNLSFDERRKARAIKRAGGRYFSVPGPESRGKLRPGVYQRDSAGGIKPIFIFVARTQYRPRFAFERVARATAEAVFPVKFEAQMRAVYARQRGVTA